MKKEINGNKLTILEPIITINDAMEIKNAIEEIARINNLIVIDIKNSFSFPSSIIALLEKLKDEGKRIEIIVRDETLYELFEDLNLTHQFTIIKE